MQLATVGAVAHCARCSAGTCSGQMAVFTAHEYKKNPLLGSARILKELISKI